MKQREKLLAGLVIGMFVLLAGGLGLKRFFTAPLGKVDAQIKALRDKLSKADVERRDYFSAEDYLKEVTQTTYGTDVNQASARLGENLAKQLAIAGLNEADFTRLPVGPRKLRGASEIGWSIQGKGDLQKVVNLLFLLENDPHVHRLENLTLTAHERPGEIKLRFFYLTVVVEPAPETEKIDLKNRYTLDGPERVVYNSILERDILRPYIKRPPPPPAPAPGQPAAPGSQAPGPPGPESYKVVSLSDWNGVPEVHIRDLVNNKTLAYKPGDKLTVGEVVAIDYRPMQSAKSSILRSDSRVVLKINNEFWAVERGQTLAERRKLEPNQWPIN